MPKNYRIRKIPQGTWVAESPTDVITFPAFYNPLDYGPSPDGVTSNSAAILAAARDAATAGGGVVFLSEGTWRAKSLPLYNNVLYIGSGIGATIVKLEDNANTDLFSANTANINLSGAVGAGSAIGVTFFGFRDLTLDGNKANQTSGTSYPVRAYGYGHVFEHVEVLNGYSGGLLLDWNNAANPTPPANALMPRWYDVMVHDCNGINIQVGGPTDMQWIGVNGFNSGSHVVHLAPNCVALMMSECHYWGTPVGVSAVTLLCEAPQLDMACCQIEGSDTCALVLLGNDNQGTGLEIGTVDVLRAGRGIQLGQPAGGTPIPGQIYQSAGARTAATSNLNSLSGKLFGCVAGALDEQNTASNIYNLIAYQTSGTAVVGGYPNQFSSGMISVSGLTQDGSPGKGGIFQIANGSFNGFRVFDKNGAILFNIDTYDSVFAVDNGRVFSGYSDAGVTQTYSLDASHGNITANGNLSVGMSATDVAIGTSGTIATANIGLSRVAPTGNVTGVILQAGTVNGQQITVRNNSAFTITFAASGTSHVSDGVSDVIAANTARDFRWDGALWYPVK